MNRAPSRLLRATKDAAAPRLVSAKNAAVPRLVSAVKRAAPLAPVLALSVAGCGIFTALGDYEAQQAAPDTACCASGETYYACDVLLQGEMAVGDTPDPVELCSTDIDTANAAAVSIAQRQYPALLARSENCETPGCPADGGAP